MSLCLFDGVAGPFVFVTSQKYNAEIAFVKSFSKIFYR